MKPLLQFLPLRAAVTLFSLGLVAHEELGVQGTVGKAIRSWVIFIVWLQQQDSHALGTG